MRIPTELDLQRRELAASRAEMSRPQTESATSTRGHKPSMAKMHLEITGDHGRPGFEVINGLKDSAGLNRSTVPELL
ncbi:hypothetical protein NL676_002055 [Syzygium grande]|nr:hypothetical protein NL676_002055 [Syzygium grande]